MSARENHRLFVEMLESRFSIKKSTVAGAGKGLFAGRSIGKSDKLRVQGILVRRNSASDRYTHYADAYKFRVGTYLLIPLGCAAMINHSLAPNLEKVIQGKNIYLQALRPIAVGEELFFRYSSYAQKRFRLNLL